jgi:hypothetical protein
VRIATKETREGGSDYSEGYVDGFAAAYRLSEPLWGYECIRVSEGRSIFDGWQLVIFPATAEGEPVDDDSAPFVLISGRAGEKFNPKFFDSFIADYGYMVVEDEKRFTLAEIAAAFEAIKKDLDENFGEGTGATERYLIDDVAKDVRLFLEQDGVWAVGLKSLVDGLVTVA